MDQQRYQFTKIPVGYIKYGILGSGVITATYQILLDVTMPSIRRYNHHIIINRTDADLLVRLDDSGDEYPAIRDILGIAFDDILVETTISIKARSALPTTGEVIAMVW